VVTSRLANPTATIAVLQAHGLYTKKSYGQHFLVDDNVVRRIIELAGIEPDEPVLEVGPGIGTLTVALCEAAGAVVAVEADAALPAVLAETLAECSRPITLVEADAVAVPIDALTTPLGIPRRFVANLPYAVAATLVLRYFEEMPQLASATIMVQAEVAARMAAKPRTKEYGAYTVKLALRALPNGRFAVARNSFLPPPRVDSTVIRLDRRTWSDDVTEADLVAAARAADAAFSQRRKTLRNAVSAALNAPSAAVEAALAAADIDPAARAETLEPERFIALGRALVAAGLLAV
jgi:16S rRNA (adenine1518-N6/adenine1519-N6)-dimethyltransferase